MGVSNKKHILLVIRHPVGGIRTYIKYIYSQKIFEQYYFTIIAPDLDLSRMLDDVFKRENYQYIPIKRTIDFIFRARAIIKNEGVDLIHSHGFTAGSLLSIPARIYRIPHIMTAHDAFQEGQFTGFRGKFKKWVLSMLFGGIDAIHAVSNDSAINIKKYFPKLDSNNIYPIQHGIDTDKFLTAEAEDWKNTFDRESLFLIGFFGRFMSPKGFRYLVDAVELIIKNNALPKDPMVLAFGWGGYVREEFEEIEKRGLKKYFKLMPYAEDMPASIKGVDIVVMPSLWEACGLLAMEALVSGVPIIGTSCIGLREVLNDTPAVMVPPADSNALAVAIITEMNNYRLKEFKDYASIAKKKFSIERPASELSMLYNKLM